MSHTDVPAGKIAAVVTSLEMFERPEPRAGRVDRALALERAPHPQLAWFRDLFRRVGENWIWFSRLAMTDAAVGRLVAG